MRNKMLLGNIGNRRNIMINNMVIAVSAVSSGTGSTHFSIMLANYLSELGKEVALLELNSTNAFSFIQSAYEGNKGLDSTKSFKIGHVTYFKTVQNNILQILNKQYNYYILDIGSGLEMHIDEFLRGDIKLIMCHSAEWKKYELIEFEKKYNQTELIHNQFYVCNYGNRKDIKDMLKYTNHKIFSLGYNPDPYILHDESRSFINQIFRGGE